MYIASEDGLVKDTYAHCPEVAMGNHGMIWLPKRTASNYRDKFVEQADRMCTCELDGPFLCIKTSMDDTPTVESLNFGPGIWDYYGPTWSERNWKMRRPIVLDNDRGSAFMSVKYIFGSAYWTRPSSGGKALQNNMILKWVIPGTGIYKRGDWLNDNLKWCSDMGFSDSKLTLENIIHWTDINIQKGYQNPFWLNRMFKKSPCFLENSRAFMQNACSFLQKAKEARKNTDKLQEVFESFHGAKILSLTDPKQQIICRKNVLKELCGLGEFKGRWEGDRFRCFEQKKNVDKVLPLPDTSPVVKKDWKKEIDMVIPSSLGSEQSKQLERSRTDDHSLYWQLISISKNAPWIRKIFILVNGNIECPYDLPNNIHVEMVDRCDYMEHCPTKNIMAIQTMIHKIPELSEHFILTEDDIIFGRPVVPDDFFTTEGKPFAWRKKPTWSDGITGEHHRLYVKPEVFTGKTPTSASPMPHFMYPMLKSYAAELAETYKDWYAFVESHKEGRFSSQSNSINDKRNSQEEDLQGVWDSNLIKSGVGVYKNINSKRGSLWDEVSISKAGFEKVIRTKPMFLNVNDRFSKDAVQYKKQIKWFWDSMEKLFGVQLKWKQDSELNTSDELKLPVGTCEFSKFPDNIIVPDLDQPDIYYKGRDCVQECQCAYPKSLTMKKIKSNCKSQLSIPEQLSIPDLDAFDEIKCPWDDSANRYHDEERYAERAGQCSRAKGMWGGSYTRSYHCMMQWAGQGLYKVGQRILDWGSGCGHKGSWLRQLYGVYVYGIDVEPLPVKWSQQHSMGSFCATDGTKLDFLKDNYFDHVHTNGAIFHLPMDKQCHVVKEFIRVTKVGGTIAIVWLGNHLKDRPSPAYSFWENCISEYKNVDIEFALSKKDVIGDWGLGPMDENAFGRYKPNYSIRISIKDKPLGPEKH